MELDLNIDSNGNVIVNTLSEYVAYISQLQAANEGSNERFFFRANPIKIGMCAHVYLERIT